MDMAVATASHSVSGDIGQAFAKYDADRSGTLTKDECVDFIKGKGLAVTRQYLEGVWTVFDQNGDGTLDKREFATLYSVLMKKSIDSQNTGDKMTQESFQPEMPVQAFESEMPAETLGVGYFGELARRSRAGEGSREIIVCSFATLAVLMLVLALLFGADKSTTGGNSDDTTGSSPEEPASENLWWVGVAMSCFACLANSFGYNFVRRAHTLVEERHAAGDKDFGVRNTWQFPVGWFCMVVLCAFLDTFALSFTDPALIAPLSGLTLVLNVWVAQLINGEQVVPLDSAVTSLILAGVIITITSGPSGAVPTIDGDYLWSHLFRPAFLFYEVVMHGSAFFVHRYCVKPLYGDMTEEGIREGRLQNPRLNEFAPVLLPWVGAVYTAHMNTLLGYLKGPKPDVFYEFGPYFCAVALAISCVIQLSAINNGLKAEGALVFVPIKSAFNVAQVSLASTTYFETLDTMGGWQTARYLLGLSSVIYGVLLITLRPDTEGQDGSRHSDRHSEEANADTARIKAGGNLSIRDGGFYGSEAAEQRQYTARREHVENPLASTENSDK